MIIENDYDFFSFHPYDFIGPYDTQNPHWGQTKDGRWIGTMDLIQAYYQKVLELMDERSPV